MINDRRDHLLRQIEQLGKFAARLLGLTARSAWAEADETLAEAYRSLVALPKDMLDILDVTTLRKLLQDDPNKVSLVARLLDEEAKVREAQGDEQGTKRLRERAALLKEKGTDLFSTNCRVDLQDGAGK